MACGKKIDDIDAVLLREISTGYVWSGIFLFPALISIFRKLHFQNLLLARAESLRGIFRAVYRQLEFKATGMKFKATVATSPGMGSNPMGVLKMEMMAGCKNK